MDNIPQPPSLQLVQLEGDTALIDSRVFCSEVLLVDHSDWLQNVLYTYQTDIELRFGLLRFENGYVNIPNGGKKDTKYALLTEAQCNACLVLSRNLRRTIALKLDLVADFERAKALVKEYFEQRLATAIAPAIVNAIAPTEQNQYPELADLSNAEVYRLANEYLRVREMAAKQYPSLIKIFDALANPEEMPQVTRWFSVKSWLAENGYKMTQRQYRHLCRAIADCHRFLTVAQPRKFDGVNYYSNQHEILLKTCADNTLKLASPTVPFV